MLVEQFRTVSLKQLLKNWDNTWTQLIQPASLLVHKQHG